MAKKAKQTATKTADVACPSCGAKAGEECKTASGATATAPHAGRKEAAAKKPAKTAKAKANGKGSTGRIIRVAAVENPTTGREVLVRLRTDGVITDNRLRERLGVEGVKEWREVPASRWAEATAGFKAGKGEVVKAKQSRKGKAKK